MKKLNLLWIFVLIFIISIMSVSAASVDDNVTTDAGWSFDNRPQFMGYNINTTNKFLYLESVTTVSICTATRVYVYNTSDGALQDAAHLIGNYSVVSNVADTENLLLVPTLNYTISAGSDGANYDRTYKAAGGAIPFTGINIFAL